MGDHAFAVNNAQARVFTVPYLNTIVVGFPKQKLKEKYFGDNFF